MQPHWDAIRDENRALEIRSIAALGEGWTARAFLVNDELVFKFPKRAGDWEELDLEIAFLDAARARLPLPVAKHLYQVRDSVGASHGYAVYRHLAGHALTIIDLADPEKAALAAMLASFLRALHEMAPGPALAPVLRHDDERALAEAYLRDTQDEIAPELTEAERQRLAGVFREHLDDGDNFPARPCIIHADLSAAHVLCVGGSITGILDWGDVSVGDPDYEFSSLYGDFGEAFVRDIARQYGHDDVDRMVRKARYFRIVDQIDTIVYGGERALAGDLEAAWQLLRSLLRKD